MATRTSFLTQRGAGEDSAPPSRSSSPPRAVSFEPSAAHAPPSLPRTMAADADGLYGVSVKTVAGVAARARYWARRAFLFLRVRLDELRARHRGYRELDRMTRSVSMPELRMYSASRSSGEDGGAGQGWDDEDNGDFDYDCEDGGFDDDKRAITPAPQRFRAVRVPGFEVWRIIPALLWYVMFSFNNHFLPSALRPEIHTGLLPQVELGLFGTLPHTHLDKVQNLFLDIIAAFVYTFHAALPALFIFLVYRKQRSWQPVGVFVWCFGIMNAAGVFTQIILPTAPPWYYDKNGVKTASYAMKGDPAGLARVDEYFQMRFFHNVYESSPVVFGAFPSLHAAWPFLICVFGPSGVCGIARKYLVTYALVVFWAANYLRHHYIVDILAGALYAFGSYWFFGKPVLERGRRARVGGGSATPVSAPASPSPSPPLSDSDVESAHVLRDRVDVAAVAADAGGLGAGSAAQRPSHRRVLSRDSDHQDRANGEDLDIPPTFSRTASIMSATGEEDDRTFVV